MNSKSPLSFVLSKTVPSANIPVYFTVIMSPVAGLLPKPAFLMSMLNPYVSASVKEGPKTEFIILA